jgi:hypothetical protein
VSRRGGTRADPYRVRDRPRLETLPPAWPCPQQALPLPCQPCAVARASSSNWSAPYSTNSRSAGTNARRAVRRARQSSRGAGPPGHQPRAVGPHHPHRAQDGFALLARRRIVDGARWRGEGAVRAARYARGDHADLIASLARILRRALGVCQRRRRTPWDQAGWDETGRCDSSLPPGRPSWRLPPWK